MSFQPASAAAMRPLSLGALTHERELAFDYRVRLGLSVRRNGRPPFRLEVEPEPIAACRTPHMRRAYQVQAFHPAKLVPGVKTRRLDRLSCWALVAASLALQDAG